MIFCANLTGLAARFSFISRDAFSGWVEGNEAPDGILLTFDDGLRDHLDTVLSALRVRSFWGLFYVSSRPALEGKMLDVHKLHLVLGRLGGERVLAWIEMHAPHILPPEHERDLTRSHYVAQSSDNATKFVKQLFNWQLSTEERGCILDRLLQHAFDGRAPDWHDIYLSELRIAHDGRCRHGCWTA